MKPLDPRAMKDGVKPVPPAAALKASDLFLPSVIEVVHHLARMAAEKDYRHFLATGQIPYSDPDEGAGP